jgi:hypothetical protein
MKNLVIISNISIIAFFFLSCEKSIGLKDYNPHHIIKIDLDDSKSQVENLINTIEDVNLIPLELTDSFILSKRPQARVTSDYFYFFDNKQEKLFGFTYEGKFLFQIDNRGNGPEEYIKVANFSLTKDSMITIYDKAKANLLYFDHKNGEFKTNRNIDCQADEVSCLDNNLLVAFTKNLSIFDNDKSSLRLIDSTGSVMKSFLPLPKWIRNSSLRSTTGSDFFYNEIDLRPYLVLPWSTYVFSVSPDSVYCNYYIDFGENNIPNSFFEKFQDKIDSSFDLIMKQIIENNWVFAIDYFQESSNFIFFQSAKKRSIYYTLYNKNNEDIFSSAFDLLPSEWALIFKPFIASYEDTFYSMISAEQLNILMQLEDLTDYRLKKVQSQYKEYKIKYNYRLDDEDFILISYKMKKG